MLNHPTLDRLRELGLDGMAKGFCDLAANPESRALEHAEWLGLLVEQEATLRQQKRFAARARAAKLRHAATIEDVDFRTPRGLASALPDHRAVRHWQVVVGLCLGRQGLPRQSVGALPAQLAAVRQPGTGAR